MVRFFTATALAVGLALSAGVAQANITINIDTVVGTWSDVQPVNTQQLSGVGTNEIRWGTTNNTQSGYRFDGNAPQSGITSPFDIGTFTHFNFPIQGTPTPASINSAVLDVILSGTITDGTTPEEFSLTSSFLFNHNETPNTGSGNCCNDIVTLVSSTFSGDTVNIRGVEYVFGVTGFLQNGTPFNTFSTVEGQANVATLQGEFRVAPIPLPAGVLLLGLGLAGMAGVRRMQARRKAA
jgi:hypothetical protein